MTRYTGKPVLEPGQPEPKERDHYIQCEACGGWIDMRDLMSVLAHEGPLPHPEIDRPQ